MPKQSKGKVRRNVRSGRPAVNQRRSQGKKDPEKVKNDFQVLASVCEIIGQSARQPEAFEKVLNLIGRSVEYSRASLFLLDRRTSQMREVASVGKRIDLIDFVRFDAGAGLSAWVAKEKRPVLLSNLHRKRGGETVKSFLAIPLILNDELFGVMNLGHIRAHAFEAGDVELLRLVSAPITLGLERMYYHSEADRLHAEVEQTRQHCNRLEEELAQLRSAVPTAQLLESLNQRIKIPLSDIAENAQFLLDSFAPRQEEKTSRSGRRSKVEIKRGLREIRNEANQITRATERLLKRSLV